MARSRENADDLLALALAGGAEVAKAAEQASVSLSTAWRRIADPKFSARVRQLRSEMVDRATGTLSKCMAGAAVVLGQLLGSASENIRRRAARDLIELGVRLRESVELEQRIAELEARLTDKAGAK